MNTNCAFNKTDEVEVRFGFFPLTPALFLGERGYRSPRFEKSEEVSDLGASNADRTKRRDEATGAMIFKDGADALPLPKGEGRGEGEGRDQILKRLLTP